MDNYYADLKRGVLWMVEVFERGQWRVHTTTGTRAMARQLIIDRRLVNARISQFKRV